MSSECESVSAVVEIETKSFSALMDESVSRVNDELKVRGVIVPESSELTGSNLETMRLSWQLSVGDALYVWRPELQDLQWTIDIRMASCVAFFVADAMERCLAELQETIQPYLDERLITWMNPPQ